MKHKNLLLLVAVGIILLVSAGLAIGYFIFQKQPAETTNESFNTVSDTSTGLTFNMSKSFAPIAKDQLAAMNPGFNYGFKPDSDANALCIISQSQLKGSGSISGADLKDGLLKEVRKLHPDIKLNNQDSVTKLIKFGDATGILVDINYKQGAYTIRRVEVIAVGKKTQAIAYCQSLAQDNSKYYSDFTTFFSSLKLE